MVGVVSTRDWKSHERRCTDIEQGDRDGDGTQTGKTVEEEKRRDVNEKLTRGPKQGTVTQSLCQE